MSLPVFDTAIRQELAGYRQSIDNIDAALVHMLAERFRCTQAVGVLKAKYDLPAADPARRNTRSNVCGSLPRTPSSTRILPRLS